MIFVPENAFGLDGAVYFAGLVECKATSNINVSGMVALVPGDGDKGVEEVHFVAAEDGDLPAEVGGEAERVAAVGEHFLELFEREGW